MIKASVKRNAIINLTAFISFSRITTRIMKTILKGVVFAISPFIEAVIWQE